jgi:hypothetical protein
MTGFVSAIAIDSSTGGSFLGDITGTNAIDDAAAASSQGNAAARAATLAAATQARGDVNRIFPQAQRAAQQGSQAALDIFGQSLPAQTDVFSQGNVGAQQAILSGLPQIQNALLGGNVDFSQMQPFEVQQPDLGFFQQELPQTANIAENRYRDNRSLEREELVNRLNGPGVGPYTRQGILDTFDQNTRFSN